MKLSTRLLLPLLAAVVVVMLAYATASLIQREGVMVAEAERETRAYATALGLALERAATLGEPGAIQEMIDRIDRDPNIYGVIVYDTLGLPEYVSSPLVDALPADPGEVRGVASDGTPRAVRRDVLGDESVVVFRPLLAGGHGPPRVLEVVQPLSSIEVQLARTRERFVLNTLTLIAAVTLLLSWLVRRHLSTPLARFVKAVRALGGGELSHRVEPAIAVGELAEVAEELNRMADRLESARRELVHEGEEKVALERRLSQSERLAELGRLAAGLAHEIGAPLQVIRGRADQALKAVPDSSARDRNLRIIIEQIDRITIIVRNLMGYAKRRDPRVAQCDLLTVLQGVVDFLEAEADRMNVGLTLETSLNALPMSADADLLHQVFLNVVLNALHALDDAGDPGPRAVRVVLDRSQYPEQAIVEVEDNGPGIPPELRDRVFDPFYTTKTAGRGTGLGLALARAIVEDHGGTIQILPPSGPRWSTRVRIALPAPPAPAGTSSEPIIEAGAYHG